MHISFCIEGATTEVVRRKKKESKKINESQWSHNKMNRNSWDDIFCIHI